MDMHRFTITEDHLKLCQRLYFGYAAAVEFGAPAVDPKRPYGNSDVWNDLGEILGIEPVWRDALGQAAFTADQLAHMLKLHKEIATVLEIATRVGRFEAGTYVTRAFASEWQRVEAGNAE